MNHQSESRNKNRAFARTMAQARTHMNPLQQLWSKLIHLRLLEISAASLGASVARPLALICGAIGSIITVLLTYGIAKALGYTLSGFEGATGFFFGWTIGIIIEFIKAMVSGGKRSR